MAADTPTFSCTAPNPVLPTSWLGGGFRLLWAAIASPNEWRRLTSESGLQSDTSLAGLRTELAESTLVVVSFVIQLAVATITTVVAVLLLTLGAVFVLEPTVNLAEALRPLILLGGVGLGFGAITVCALGVRAGIAASVLAPATAAPVAVLGMLVPHLQVAGRGIFSNGGGVRALGYSLGGFAIGAAVAITQQYLRADAASSGVVASEPPRVRTIIANLFLAFTFLLGYSLTAFFALQAIPGAEEEKYAIVIFAFLPLLGILYRQYRSDPRSTWKVYGFATAPTLTLLTISVGIFATLEKYIRPSADHWIDRLGVGLLAGALLAGALVFLSSMLAPLFPRSDDRARATTISSGTLMVTWICLLVFGAFNNLNQGHRFYTVSGAFAGAFSIWLGSLLLTRARVRYTLAAGLLALPLLGFAASADAALAIRGALEQSGYPGNYTLTGTSEVRAKATFLGREIEYNRTFTPDFDAIVTATSVPGQLIFTLTHKGKVQRLVGIIQENGTVTFRPGQRSPLHFERDGFSAELVGTLRQGTARRIGGGLRVRTSWTAEGTVRLGPIPRDVSGTIVNDLSGPRR